MKLSELAGAIPDKYEIIGNGDVQIDSLCTDSRKASPGSLFFCIPGLHIDAHDLAPQAVEKGAAALVVERKLDVDCPQVRVESVRRALSYMAQAFFGYPARRMKLIGITGTKGKTTASFLIKSILEAAGHKTGLIGTVCSMIGEEVYPSRLTTPDPVLLHREVDAAVVLKHAFIAEDAPKHIHGLIDDGCVGDHIDHTRSAARRRVRQRERQR